MGRPRCSSSALTPLALSALLPLTDAERQRHLHHLGLAPFEQDFYLPEGAPTWLVERIGPVLPTQKEFTLAQVREDL